MGDGSGPVIQPPETQNAFAVLAIIVALVWMINASRRCWAVMELRHALGTRRLVAIRGVGRRVRIFRLIGRHYLQRALVRNHLQALVHTRQAYPPKAMPCSLLLASPSKSNTSVKVVLHPKTEGGEAASPPPSSAASRVRGVDGNGTAGVGPGVTEAGPLVGVSLELDCRVACTVELLWDVDLSSLGKEMGLPPKLHLLPASTRGGSNGVDGVGASVARGESTSSSAVSAAPPGTDSGTDGSVAVPEASRSSSFTQGLWGSVGSVIGRVLGSGGGGGNGNVIIESSSMQHRAHSSSNGGILGDVAASDNAFDEEMGGTLDGNVGGVTNGNATDGSGEARTQSGGRTWATALSFRKSTGLGGGNGSLGSSSRGHGSLSGPAGGGHARGAEGVGMNGAGGPGGGGVGSGWLICGKRTVPRALVAGSRQKFEALSGESYFRIQPDGGGGVGGTNGRAGGLGTGAMAGSNHSSVGASGRGRLRAGGLGVGGRRGRSWPSLADSIPAGRCSLAIVIRPVEGAETSEWTGWRHRPTHRVTRQVLLVQLTERSAAGVDASGQRQVPPTPSATVLRHLVAISKGVSGETESIYAFSEVFGAADDAGGMEATDPSSVSAVVSATPTAGGNGGANTSITTNTGVLAITASSSGAGGGDAGGEDLSEECVICLTDPKDTLLLPCRHLCVCSDCFRHVDKCPVCRAAFDNYIVLGRAAPQPVAVTSTAGAAAGSIFASSHSSSAGAPSAAAAANVARFPSFGRTAAVAPTVRGAPPSMGAVTAEPQTAESSSIGDARGQDRTDANEIRDGNDALTFPGQRRIVHV